MSSDFQNLEFGQAQMGVLKLNLESNW